MNSIEQKIAYESLKYYRKCPEEFLNMLVYILDLDLKSMSASDFYEEIEFYFLEADPYIEGIDYNSPLNFLESFVDTKYVALKVMEKLAAGDKEKSEDSGYKNTHSTDLSF